jgi:hypothetical protein
MINIPLILAGTGGAYLLWRWYKSATTPYGGDGAGNPQGTDYDEDGNATPPPPDGGLPGDVWDPGRGEWGSPGAVGSGLFWKWSPEMWRDAFTRPATEDGGLRVDPRSDLLDSRFTAYGQLAMSLEAHDSHVFVFDGDSPAANKFQIGKVVRLMICEEPIICVAVGRPQQADRTAAYAPFMSWASQRPAANPGDIRCPGPVPVGLRDAYRCGRLWGWLGNRQVVAFEILNRPMMSNWQNQGVAHRIWDPTVSGTDRDGSMATQQQRWSFYDVDNPTYGMMRPTTILPEWAQERRKNCGHWMHATDPGYPNLTYDPTTDACRQMTVDEIAAVEAHDSRLEAEASAATASQESECESLYGVSCAEEQRWELPSMTAAEKDARKLSLQQRMTGLWSFVSDLPDEAQARLAGLVNKGWTDSGEIREVRRSDGAAAYRGLTVLMKREVSRDYAVLGAFERIAVGGPFGWAAIWQKPPMAPTVQVQNAAPTAQTRQISKIRSIR